MTPLLPVVVFMVALVTSVAVIPPIRRIAVFRRLLDFPDDSGRRDHKRPVPRLGGVAVFAGFLAALGVAAIGERVLRGTTAQFAPHSLDLLLACTILFAIGLADDIKGVRPSLKLLGQSLAALIVYRGGFAIEHLGFPPDYVLNLGWLAMPVTVLWLVGVSNAFNLVDGMDGLAGGVGIIALATIAATATVLGNPTVPVYAIALAGALVGFLRFNAAPARIFLGDSGSLVIGFLLAYLSAKGATRHGAVLALVPIFALSYPLLDTGIAMVRRWLRGTPLSRADGRHIHHQLRGLGLEPRRAVYVIYTEAAAVAVLGLSATFAPPAMTVFIAALGAAVLLVILVYGARWLEYHELLDAGAILATGARRARGAIRDTINARDISQLIRAARTREEVNGVIGDAAELFRFAGMQVGPSLKWTRGRVLADSISPRLWKVEYPILSAQGDPILDALGEPIVLTIQCSMSRRIGAASVERIAEILAPAIASWSERAEVEKAHQPVHVVPTAHLVNRRESGMRKLLDDLSTPAQL